MNTNKLYINGEYVDSKSEKWIEVENPANEEIIAKVPRSNEEDVNLAVKAAKEAFKSWSKVDINKRIEYVEKFNDWMKNHKEEFLKTMTEELGVPHDFCEKSQFDRMPKRTENFIKQAKDFKLIDKMDGGYVRREPIGVIACITPWNYPLGQIIQKVIPAIIAGNTIVLKPSKQTPLTAYLLVKGFDEIGLPKGVLNLVTGAGSEVGNVMSSHEDVDMVSFTGSTKGGIEVGKAGLETVKNITLELGGKSPAVFIEGADVEKGVKQVLNTIFLNTGQTCSALSRIVVLESEKEKVVNEVLKQYDNYIVGDPKDPDVNVGPLSSKKQFEKVQKYVQKGIDEGAKLLKGEKIEKNGRGYYVKPVVFDNVTTEMSIHKDEIFGPVLVIETAKDYDELIEIANAVDYGLSSAVFGEKEKAIEIAEKIKAGEVSVNNPSGDINLPFGGYKQSGIGREGGSYGLDEYFEVKSVIVD
ncbi:MAG: aldehyde dehydrogenase family protein [Tissierellia bacterium]|nr:aldehyde dehydrogenase family protein [Tissierellia bacterium]